jgi:hypothetical protein
VNIHDIAMHTRSPWCGTDAAGFAERAVTWVCGHVLRTDSVWVRLQLPGARRRAEVDALAVCEGVV